MPRRRPAVLAAAGAGLLALWLGTGFWLGPALIRRAWAGRSLPLLNRLISGQANHPVAEYIGTWYRVFLGGTATVILAMAALYIGVRWRRSILTAIRRGLLGAPHPSLPEYLWSGIATGILLGFAEAGPRVLKALLTGDPREAPALASLWMAPAMGAVSVLLIATVLALTLGRWPRLSRRAVVFAGIFVVVRAALRGLALGIHPLAADLLAAGAATAVSGWYLARPDPTRSVLRPFAVGGLVLVGGLAVGLTGLGFIRGRYPGGAGTANEAGTETPNVLLLILDTVRAADLGIYGYARATTPALERWFADGMVFDRAFAPAPWTLPSHAAMFTGRWPDETSTDFDRRLDDTFPTVAEGMRAHGYATGGFVGNLLYTAGRWSGLGRGFGTYRDHPVSWNAALESLSLPRRLALAIRDRLGRHGRLVRQTAEEVNREFLDWLPERPGRPFFAFLNYFDAHHQYETHPPFDTLFGAPPRYWIMQWGKRYTPDELEELRRAYDSAIAYLDHQIGLLLEELDRRGVLRNTIVILASDHGEQFGEHGVSIHANSLYAPVLHVPLMIRGPGVPGGRVATPVSIRDIARTVFDLAGQSAGAIGGESLARYWTPGSAGAPVPTWLPTSLQFNRFSAPTDPIRKGPMTGGFAWPYHYIRNGNGREELYDLSADPDELHNLAADPNHAALLDTLRRRADSVHAVLHRDAHGAAP